MIGDYLDSYTYESILQNALSRVPDTIDKREGSIIYDAVAPACAELAKSYIALKGIYLETYVMTAQGEYLEYRVAEQGMTRFPATRAVKRAVFKNGAGQPKSVPIGSRFSTKDLDININYEVTGIYSGVDGEPVPGSYMLACEAPGTSGNGYMGELLPITFISDLAIAWMDTLLIPARDEETDDELRARYKEKVDTKAFGGNIAQYDQEVRAMEGVGEVQVYPVWNGGGTVKCSIIGSDFNKASQTLISEVQEALDPNNMESKGQGMGLAPIGHKVTVTTATEVPIDVTATIALSNGYDAESVIGNVKSALDAYLLNVRKQWGLPDDFNHHHQNVYISQVNYAIVSVAGVENVTDIRLNGEMTDILLAENAALQELPILGAVVIDVN